MSDASKPIKSISRYMIHGLVTADGVRVSPTSMVLESDYDELAAGIKHIDELMSILRAQHALLREDANAATLRCAELALQNETQRAEIARLTLVESEWLALSQDDGKVERALERSEAERARSEALLRELIHIEGPQPGTRTWYEKVCAALGVDPARGIRDSEGRAGAGKAP